MKDAGIFDGHSVYFVAIWYIFWQFGINFPVLVFCTKKNLPPLPRSTQADKRTGKWGEGRR
jgi:hypothetical protein